MSIKKNSVAQNTAKEVWKGIYRLVRTSFFVKLKYQKKNQLTWVS